MTYNFSAVSLIKKNIKIKLINNEEIGGKLTRVFNDYLVVNSNGTIMMINADSIAYILTNSDNNTEN